MSNLRTRVQIHNKYELELYDANGNIKNKAYAYNVVTNVFWSRFFGNGSDSSYYLFRYIGIGTGTGTPSISDTSFFKFLANAEATLVSKTTEYPTTTLVQKATFGASASIVGTLTEVGFTLSNSYTSCLTHAMLQDAEGNTITIDKTDTDVLIVTATLYVTVTADESLELVPANSFGLFNQLRSNHINSAVTVGGLYLSACPALPTLSALHEAYISSGSGGNTTTRSRTISTTRMPVTSGQRNGKGTYINYLFVGQFGGMRLPNEEFFQAYTLQPMSVGTGDGATTEFVCPIPDFVDGTEVVIVDGVTLTNGVDYTIDSKGNSALNASSVNAHSNFAKSISNGGKTSSSGRAYVLGTAGFGTTSGHGVYPKSTAPLVFDMGEDVECNTLFIDALVYKTNYSTTYSVPIVLEYSNDNETWAEAARLSMTAIGYGYVDRLIASDKNKMVSFDSITARYWRLYADSTNSYVRDYGVGSAYGNSFFGKVGQGIVFTNPPAEGAVITIAAKVDRPFKTADYVLDYSATLYW